MTFDVIFRQYQEYQSYLDWTAADEARVRIAAGILQTQLPLVIDDFYRRMGHHAEMRQIIDRNRTTFERLRGGMQRWLEELLSGPYDRAYVARRWQVGKRHVDLGLQQVHLSMAMAQLRSGLAVALERCWPPGQEGLMSTLLALDKLLDLDRMLIEHAYQTEYLARIGQNTRLAQLGHVAGSVGHELRGPLNVVKTSAYYLRHAAVPGPGKTAEHLQRMERHMVVTEQILEELSDFARMPAPRLRPFAVEPCVGEALAQVPLPRHIQLAQHWPPALPRALADRQHICDVFVRLIRRARDSMRDQGTLCIRGQHAANSIEVRFEDTGPQVAAETRAALEGSLSWSSVRNLGMALAVARAILDWNGSSVRADSQTGQGCTVTVTLVTEPHATPHAFTDGGV